MCSSIKDFRSSPADSTARFPATLSSFWVFLKFIRVKLSESLPPLNRTRDWVLITLPRVRMISVLKKWLEILIQICLQFIVWRTLIEDKIIDWDFSFFFNQNFSNPKLPISSYFRWLTNFVIALIDVLIQLIYLDPTATTSHTARIYSCKKYQSVNAYTRIIYIFRLYTKNLYSWDSEIFG